MASQDYIARNIALEDRIRKLELQCYARPGEMWPNRDVNPLAEWLSWGSTVDIHQYVPSQLAWHLIEAERSLGPADIETLRLIRNAREEVKAMKPMYNCGSLPCYNPDNGPKVRYSANGAVIVESFASRAQPSAIWYRQEGRWIYPLTIPGQPSYHYLQWLGSTSAFTGKDVYTGYIPAGDGMCAEEPNPFQGTRWYPQEEGSHTGLTQWEEDSYVFADNNYHYEIGFGRGLSRTFGIDEHGHIIQTGEYQEYKEWPSLMEAAFSAALDAGPDLEANDFDINLIRIAPSITEGSDHLFYTEEPILVNHETIGFPCSWIRSAEPPIFFGEAMARGIPQGVFFGGIGQVGIGTPAPKAYEQATYDQVAARAEGAIGDDLGTWVQNVLSDAPRLGYDHKGWGVAFVDDLGAPIYYLVRFGWVHLRGTMHVSTDGTGSWDFGFGSGMNISPRTPAAWFSVPGYRIDGGKRDFQVNVRQSSFGDATEVLVPGAKAGDEISLDSIMWALP